MGDETNARESLLDYTNRLKPLLASYVENERNKAVESHLEKMLWLYSYVTENFESKITKQKDLCRSFFPMVVEVQDLMRGTLIAQKENLLAGSALTLRSVFEIYVNSKFIFSSSDPKKYLQRLVDFATCEEILGQKFSPELPTPSEEVEKKFAALHPYWATKTGKLKDSPTWNGDDKSLKSLCEDLKIEEFYYRVYKPTSKFVHGSPVVRNLYKRGNSMGAVAPQPHTTRMCLLAGEFVHRFLKESCEFFGVTIPAEESAKIKAEFETLATADSRK